MFRNRKWKKNSSGKSPRAYTEDRPAGDITCKTYLIDSRRPRQKFNTVYAVEVLQDLEQTSPDTRQINRITTRKIYRDEARISGHPRPQNSTLESQNELEPRSLLSDDRTNFSFPFFSFLFFLFSSPLEASTLKAGAEIPPRPNPTLFERQVMWIASSFVTFLRATLYPERNHFIQRIYSTLNNQPTTTPISQRSLTVVEPQSLNESQDR